MDEQKRQMYKQPPRELDCSESKGISVKKNSHFVQESMQYILDNWSVGRNALRWIPSIKYQKGWKYLYRNYFDLRHHIQ